MNCCGGGGGQGACPGTAKMFSKKAKSYRKRHEKKGLEHSQKRLLKGISEAGFEGQSITEIGCGIGYFHQELLENGATEARGYDISDIMIDEARDRAQTRELASRTEYHVGDFVEMSGNAKQSDILIMDKVICCYPDAEALVKTSTAITNKIWAVTYPKGTWLARLGIRVLGMATTLARMDYVPFAHDPKDINRWAAEAGFSLKSSDSGVMWLTEIYSK